MADLPSPPPVFWAMVGHHVLGELVNLDGQGGTFIGGRVHIGRGGADQGSRHVVHSRSTRWPDISDIRIRQVTDWPPAINGQLVNGRNTMSDKVHP